MDPHVRHCYQTRSQQGHQLSNTLPRLRLRYLTPQPPAPPEKPLVVHKTQCTMLLTWRSPPAFNETITAFRIQWRVGIRQEFGNDITTPGRDFKRTITGLVPGTPYQFRVCAVNRMGVGKLSEPSPQVSHLSILLEDQRSAARPLLPCAR